MKAILFCISLLVVGIVHAQRIDNPSFKARKGSIYNVTCIERTPQETKLSIHAIFRPNWWISLSKDCYLMDAETGAHYTLLRAEHFVLGEKNVMPSSGAKDFTLIFNSLPKETKAVHLINPHDNETDIFDLSLSPAEPDPSPLLKQIEGNWFDCHGTAHWVCGIIDSTCLINNRFYQISRIGKKGKRIIVNAHDKNQHTALQLLFRPLKNNRMEITLPESEACICQAARPLPTRMEPDAGFQSFFSKDSAYIQGYIKGYDTRLNFANGMIYLNDILTNQDKPWVVEIAPNGHFRCALPITHPIESNLLINNNWIPFYIEPGQTLTVYIDWEAILAYERARNRTLRIKDIHYMGPSASLSYLLSDITPQLYYPYTEIEEATRHQTPHQFHTRIQALAGRWKEQADSVCQVYADSKKAVRLIQNKIKINAGKTLLEYEMLREFQSGLASPDIPVNPKAGKDFYAFLLDGFTNDSVLLADKDANIFINRFEYMRPLTACEHPYTPIPADSVQDTQAEAALALSEAIRTLQAKDAVIAKLCSHPQPFIWQVAKIRDLRNSLAPWPSKEEAQPLFDVIRSSITHPLLRQKADAQLATLFPEERQKSYRLPEGKATEIFRNIVRNHPGKSLFIDFWATTCGPCRSGIEHTAALRKSYKDHPDVQFIFITGENDSPRASYDAYVAKHLKGEVCYYLSSTDYNYLRQLFRFNGIPHYVFMNKDGSILKEELSTYNIEPYIKAHFAPPVCTE